MDNNKKRLTVFLRGETKVLKHMQIERTKTIEFNRKML